MNKMALLNNTSVVPSNLYETNKENPQIFIKYEYCHKIKSVLFRLENNVELYVTNNVVAVN